MCVCDFFLELFSLKATERLYKETSRLAILDSLRVTVFGFDTVNSVNRNQP